MIFLSKAYQFCSSLQEDQVFSAEVTMSHSSCILSFVLIGENQNKRFYVTEIVFAAHIHSPFFSEGEKRQGEICLQFTG